MTTQTILPRAMTLDEFAPLVGRPLMVDCNPAEVELTLVEATASPDNGFGDIGVRPPFILVFRSRPEVRLIDGIYAMRGHGFGPDLIAISSLIAPLRAAPGHYYQAIFN